MNDQISSVTEEKEVQHFRQLVVIDGASKNLNVGIPIVCNGAVRAVGVQLPLGIPTFELNGNPQALVIFGLALNGIAIGTFSTNDFQTIAPNGGKYYPLKFTSDQLNAFHDESLYVSGMRAIAVELSTNPLGVDFAIGDQNNITIWLDTEI